MCRADGPVLDSDCCGADGDCFDGCGTLDPDCEPVEPTEPVAPGGDDGTNDAGSLGADDEPSDDGGLIGKVTCGFSAAPPRQNGWAFAILALGLVTRRRTRS